jgi:hypothetical protein
MARKNYKILPEVVFIQLSSWRWAHSCSKHVEDSNKRIIEKTVRQVGYLPELYENARSEKIIKFCDAKQAKQLYEYKNIKINLYKKSAAIW